MRPLGLSVQGLPVEALLLSATTRTPTDSASAAASERPTVLLHTRQAQGAGTEALLIVAHDLVQGTLRPLLSRINVLIAPVPDDEVGSATPGLTGGRVRDDALQLATKRAQALAKLSRDHDATVVLALQDYAVPGPWLQKWAVVPKADVWLTYARAPNLPEFLTKAAEEWFHQPLLDTLKGQGLGTEGWIDQAESLTSPPTWGIADPANGLNVDGLKNRISLLVASRGDDLAGRHRQRRVHAQVTAIRSVLNSAAKRASELRQLKPYLDREVMAKACQDEVLIQARPSLQSRSLRMLDPDTGLDKTVTVEVASADQLISLATRIRPCGYWLNGQASTVVERLRWHGVKVQRITEPASLLGDLYRARAAVTPEAAVDYPLVLQRGVLDAPAGSYYISLAQALGTLVVAALEPDSPHSYLSQGLLAALKDVARVMSPPAMALQDLP